MVSDVKPDIASSNNDLQNIHYEALAELAKLSLQLQPLSETAFWHEIKQNVEALKHQPIHPDFHWEATQRIIQKLEALIKKIEPAQTVPTTLAHGDFTPWNMYLGQGKLHVFDWELSERLPLLFDAFHFAFQTGVLVKKAAYATIHSAIVSMKSHPLVKSMVGTEVVSFEQLYQLYLLHNISYYLLKYLKQDALHVQVHWQVNAWDAALDQIEYFRLV